MDRHVSIGIYVLAILTDIKKREGFKDGNAEKDALFGLLIPIFPVMVTVSVQFVHLKQLKSNVLLLYSLTQGHTYCEYCQCTDGKMNASRSV